MDPCSDRDVGLGRTQVSGERLSKGKGLWRHSEGVCHIFGKESEQLTQLMGVNICAGALWGGE